MCIYMCVSISICDIQYMKYIIGTLDTLFITQTPELEEEPGREKMYFVSPSPDWLGGRSPRRVWRAA